MRATQGTRRLGVAGGLTALTVAAVTVAGCGGAERGARADTQTGAGTSGETGRGAGAPLEGPDLVKLVQASYAQVPGLTVDIRRNQGDGTPVRGHLEYALQDGIIGPGLVQVRGPLGDGTDAVWDSTGATFFRAVGTKCWRPDQPFGAVGTRVFAPQLESGARATQRADGRILLVGKETGDPTPWAWVIDPRSYRLVVQNRLRPSGTLPAEVGYFHVRGQAPVLPKPTPLCP